MLGIRKNRLFGTLFTLVLTLGGWPKLVLQLGVAINFACAFNYVLRL